MNEKGIASLILILIVIGVFAVGLISYAVMSGMLGGAGLGKDVLFKKMVYSVQQQGTGGTFVIDKSGVKTVMTLSDKMANSMPLTSEQEKIYSDFTSQAEKISLIGIMAIDATHANVYAIYSDAQTPQTIVDSANKYAEDNGDTRSVVEIKSSGKIGSFDYAVLIDPRNSDDYYVGLATRGKEVLVTTYDDEQATKLNEFITLIDSGEMANIDPVLSSELNNGQMLFYGKSNTNYPTAGDAYAFLSQSAEDTYSLSAYAEMDAEKCAEAQTSLTNLKEQMSAKNTGVPEEFKDLVGKMEISCGGKFTAIKLSNFSITNAVDAVVTSFMKGYTMGAAYR